MPVQRKSSDSDILLLWNGQIVPRTRSSLGILGAVEQRERLPRRVRYKIRPSTSNRGREPVAPDTDVVAGRMSNGIVHVELQMLSIGADPATSGRSMRHREK
jgi:hypothetical protein